MKFATIREAAESLNISEARLRRAVKSGEIPYMMLGKRTVVDIDTVATLLARPEGVTNLPLEYIESLKFSRKL